MSSTTTAIVIPALNEAGGIGGLLGACLAQSLAPSEVVVVDAGSTDGTDEIVRGFARGWSRVRLVSSPKSDPGAARNAGIDTVRSDLVVTLDGGSLPHPDWLASHVRAHAEDGQVSVGVAIGDARTEFEQAAAWFSLEAFKPAVGGALQGTDFLPAGRRTYGFSKQTWGAVGGYPHARWGEDKLFLKRLREAGVKIVVVEEAVVGWRPRRSLGAIAAQYHGYSRGDAALGLDRRNTLITVGQYLIGAGLVVLAIRGSRRALSLLFGGLAAYLGVFVVAARERLGFSMALAWVPAIRIAVDLAKISGYLRGLIAHRGPLA